jgi:multiple sugar transport system ATP-binding protein
MTTALAINAVDKIYGQGGRKPVHAVKNLNMTIERGEIVALLGSSGCGKTSTLRMIAGFEGVSNGTISLAGRRIENLPPARRGVAMAFEGYSLYPPLTVGENIAFAVKSANLAKADVDRRVSEIARLLEMEGMLGRYPSSISGGQQQRASLARALMRSADLYLLDEPMSQLEPQLRAVLRGRIKRHLKERGMTAVFVTHDQTEANALADRIAVMEGGILQQMASPAELKTRPANLYVATFVGEPPMNVFDGVVTAAGDGLSVTVEGLEGAKGFAVSLGNALSPALRERLAPGRAVVLGIRPHDIKVRDDGLKAEVASVQWLGDQTHLACLVAGRTTVAVTFERPTVAAGGFVPLKIDGSVVHLFDRDTGRALAHGTEAAG